jgi:uncharacterized protein with GYD domain
MPRYLFIASYAPEGAKGVLSKGGSARQTAIEKSVADLGGRVETFDFAFGDADVFTICELPDNKAAAALALAVNSSGGTKVKTIVLMTPEEIDNASHVSVSYQPPGTT